ncbi:MAG: hypothetical protein OXG35_10670 [Acidobacteria bacterium]|nr:hypothetical protein [Acidobacteriota bacterium]
MTATARTWSRRAGTALAVLGIAWVAMRFRRYGDALGPAAVPGVVWACAAGLAIVYAGADALLALAWRALLHTQGTPAGRAWSLQTYGVSQLSKYVPGNVMHLASRQLLGASAGVPHATLAGSSLYELVGLASAGLLLSLLALPLIDGSRFRWVTPAAGATIVLLALALVRMASGPLTARVLGYHLLFLLTASLTFATPLALLSPDAARTLPWAAACGAYAAAWLAGFLPPGAPAGLGVREAVLVLLLGGHAAEQDLLPAVVLSRVVTALGDTLFFGAAVWMGRREPADG